MRIEDKAALSIQRKEIKQWAKDNLIGQTIQHSAITLLIHFTVTGIKEALNQPHKFILEKNEAIRNIKSLLEASHYLGSEDDIKGKPFRYHYFSIQIGGEESAIVLREDLNTSLLSFYSIVDKIRKSD